MADLYIKEVEGKGRGVFSNEAISSGDVIEFCPMIILEGKDRTPIDQTGLYDYYFEWGDDGKQIGLALGYGSLYNHSTKPNALYETYFEERIMVVKAIREIKAHEEICISYNQDPDDDRKVWFEKKEAKL